MQYTVKPGDTLYGISKQFGVSLQELQSINNVAPNNLKIGQILTIPTKEGTNPDSTITYIVKKGDTLYSIARKYNTTVTDLIKLNKLTDNNLSVGQKLIIPEMYNPITKVPNFVNYTVKRGDTLYSIAKKYNTTIEDIIKDNSLNNNSLSIGQNLKIRVPQDLGVIEECYGEAYVPSNTIMYTAKKGDSLYSIAKKYNTTVDNIKKKNNLTSNMLSIGQVLKI